MSKAAFSRANTELVEKVRKLIRGMSRDSMIYKMLKQELVAQGYWKNKARGKQFKRR